MLENLMLTQGALLAMSGGKVLAFVLMIVCFVVAGVLIKKMKAHGKGDA